MASASKPFPQPACQLPGEYAILANVLTTPQDDAAKLVYADWLDEHDDPRGAFLRTWTQAKHGAKPQAPKTINKHWLSILGILLDQLLHKHGNELWNDTVRAVALPCIFVNSKRHKGNPLPCGTSKIGGLPDLPPDTEWPESENGPCAFVAQWNLAELASSPVCQSLPQTGLLSFFIDLLPYVEDSGDGETKVIYSPDLDELVEREPDEERVEENALQECRVEFAEWLTIPDYRSPIFNRLKMTDEQRYQYADFIFDVYQNLKTGIPKGTHKVLGHAMPIQDDPAPHGQKGYQLLCEFGPDEDAMLEACDGGTWYFLQKTSQLRKKKFDDLSMEFQTG
jgi:uncharacterized protein (TIGR02996 family)